jgi:hypothetical protein
MTNTAEKVAQVLASIPSTNAKVYESVPMSEPWTVSQVIMDLRRRNIGMEVQSVARCLQQLIEVGIVKEPARGHFIRVRVREPYVQQPDTTQYFDNQKAATLHSIVPATEKKTTEDAFTMLAAAASLARDLGTKYRDDLHSMADRIEQAAILMASKVETASADAEIAATLRRLLGEKLGE